MLYGKVINGYTILVSSTTEELYLPLQTLQEEGNMPYENYINYINKGMVISFQIIITTD